MSALSVTVGGKERAWSPILLAGATSAASEYLRLSECKAPMVWPGYQWSLEACWTDVSSAEGGIEFDPFSEVTRGRYWDNSPAVQVTLRFSPSLSQSDREGIVDQVESWVKAMAASRLFKSVGEVSFTGLWSEGSGPERADTAEDLVRFWWQVEEKI